MTVLSIEFSYDQINFLFSHQHITQNFGGYRQTILEKVRTITHDSFRFYSCWCVCVTNSLRKLLHSIVHKQFFRLQFPELFVNLLKTLRTFKYFFRSLAGTNEVNVIFPRYSITVLSEYIWLMSLCMSKLRNIKLEELNSWEFLIWSKNILQVFNLQSTMKFFIPPSLKWCKTWEIVSGWTLEVVMEMSVFKTSSILKRLWEFS